MTPQDWFHRRATDYVASQILFHLNRVEVFGELYLNGPLPSAELAKRLNLNEKVLDVLLCYISAVEDIVESTPKGFSISEFGKQVFDRYKRDSSSSRPKVNFFDVRIGCYGPVWSELTGMLTGEKVYGENLHRAGEFAEDALFKLSGHFYPSIKTAVEKTSASNIVEIGTNSGLLEHVYNDFNSSNIFGLDRNEATINKEKSRLSSEINSAVNWVRSDLFAVDQWSSSIKKDRDSCIFFSLHFHEFMAAGKEKMQTWIRELGQQFKGSHVLLLEQPFPLESDKKDFSETLWLYAHSNILIHHLIGNGQILLDEEWTALFLESGCELVEKKATNYLGYNSYLFRLK